MPEAADLPERLGGVLAVLFLVFNEGYLATGEGDPVRAELTGEAIRLTRVLRKLLPEEPEVVGLLGLLGPARRAGPRRLGPRADRRRPRPGPRVHRDQPTRPLPDTRRDQRRPHGHPKGSDTDWSQVVALYDQLTRLDPSPVVALNRAVAVAELDGPKVALTLVDRLPLTGYHAWHAARGELV